MADRPAAARLVVTKHDEGVPMILLSYDGSADAQAAIDRLAHVMPGATVTVLTVWEPFMQTMARTSMGWGLTGGYATADAGNMDEGIRQAALETATEGTQRATGAGLVAKPWIEQRDSDVATAIIGVAEDIDADAIVIGTRGRGGTKAFLLGSVSRAVVEHADRAVLVVPSPELAERRRDQVHHRAAA
jgi:nucleotide-binding universal stress UspA family protein